jgi:uncharacterized HAD superfamily protein
MSEGIRYDEGKMTPELIVASATVALSEVLKFGKEKYSSRNWEKGIDWERTIGSLKRHLTSIESGQDYDEESGMLHAAHVLTNAMFLNHSYYSCPELDRFNRLVNPLYGKRIALDIDGVIADFNKPFADRMGKSIDDATNWYYSYKVQEEFEKLDFDFWINLEPHFEASTLCFEPACYITHRKSEAAKKATPEWIERHKFPCMPIFFVDEAKDKSVFAKDNDIDVIVDDKFKNFYRLNNDGILCFLQDRPWNAKYDVGHLRVKHPNDIFKYRLKK